MSEKIQAFIGKTFRKLRVESYSHKDSVSRNYFVCVCTCGKKITIQQSNLLSGRSTSCGCSRRSFPTPSVVHDEPVQKSSGVHVEIMNDGLDVMSLPVLQKYKLKNMTDEEKQKFWSSNPVVRYEAMVLKKGDRVVLKNDGAVGTSNGSLWNDKGCCDVILDDGRIVCLTSINEVWKIVTESDMQIKLD